MSGESQNTTNSNNDKALEPRQSTLTLSEAQHLRKPEIVQELRKRGAQFDEDANRDTLRTQLVELVRVEISSINENAANTSAPESKHTATNNEFIETSSEDESVQSSSSDDTMSKDTKIFFNLETDDWETFSERIDLYFAAKKIDDAAIMRAELLTRCDESAYKLFRNLCAPNKPASKTYTELCTLMKTHLTPAPSEVMERYMYHRARQEQNETVAEFAAWLRQLSLHCSFKDLEEALRDQFICGIRDETTRVELFKQTTVTFDSAFKEATARESSGKCRRGTKNANR